MRINSIGRRAYKSMLFLLITVLLFHTSVIQRTERALSSKATIKRVFNYVSLGLSFFSGGKDTNHVRKKQANWRQLSAHPAGGFIEANCIIHRNHVWILSGYDCTKRSKHARSNKSFTNVYLYNYETNRWLPGPRLPTTLHHTFSSAFSIGHRIVTIGGLQESFNDVLPTTKAHSTFLELDTQEILIPYENSGINGSNWRSAILNESLRTRVEKLKGSGMTSCTQIPAVDGKYYCYLDSGNDFIKDIPRFISIEFQSDRDASLTPANESVIKDIRELSVIPLSRHSHSTLIVDLFRNEIIMLASRDSTTKRPTRESYSFSIAKNVWTRRDHIKLPKTIEPYEARASIQFSYQTEDEFSLSWLQGGQDNVKHLVTHEILAVKLFKDPSKNNGNILSFYDVFASDMLPEQLMGACITHVPGVLQSDFYEKPRLLVLGGSSNVGPFCGTSVYEWSPPSNSILATLPPDLSSKPDCNQLEFYTVEYARSGNVNVTNHIRSMLEKKIITPPGYLINTSNCELFTTTDKSKINDCKQGLTVTFHDKRLNRRYTVDCAHPNACRLIYC